MLEQPFNLSTNWHKRFFDLAVYISLWSKYPGRKVGAVIVNDYHAIVSTGYNGNPRGCNDYDLSKYESTVKYFFAEHAERNAIYNATLNGRSLLGCKIYTTLFPCADCARGIIQTGMAEVYSKRPNLQDKDFGIHFVKALKMFDECGVMVYYLNASGEVINKD